jgi:hypothetical protein
MTLVTIPDTDREVELEALPLRSIANLAYYDWSKAKNGVNYAAQPYLVAMMALDSVSDNYGADSGDMVVRYFLSNARTWRGEVAKLVKAELNRRLNA